MMARQVKHSLTIAGHRTSISLETPFWDALNEIAAARGQSLSALVAEIDNARISGGLSSAVRVYVLDHFRRASGGAPTTPPEI